MKANIHIRTIPDTNAAIGWTKGRSVVVDRCSETALSLGFNSAELLCLAVGACYTNEVFLEADRRAVRVCSVHVDVSVDGEWPAAQNLTASMRVEADADEETIAELVEHADRVAKIPNLLRLGTSVRLTDAHLVGKRVGY
jgi:uncharacterized OsmC-like protein